MKPSPAVSTSMPRWRASSRRTSSWWRVEQLAPPLVAEPHRGLGRADEVGEDDRCEHAVGHVRRPDARQELFDLAEKLLGLPEPRDVRVARELDEARTRDARRDPPRLVDVDVAVADPLQHEGRHANRRQHVAHVDLRVHPQQRRRRAGARRVPHVAPRGARSAPPTPPGRLPERSMRPHSRSTASISRRARPPAAAPTGSPRSRSVSRRPRT